jgi:hypothetical protein
MKIELKSVYFSEALSEETNAFTANVWVNNKKCGYAKNDGRGGCTEYHPYPEQRELFKQAEQWAKEQPPIKCEFNGREFEINSNMEAIIDNLLEKHLLAKEEKKKKNAYKKGIVVEIPNGYSTLSWNKPLAFMIEHYPNAVKREIKKLKDEGKVILNDNIPDEILN